MELLIILVVGALFGWLSAEMAKTRNRNTTIWAILGFLFGIFAVIVLALLGTVRDK
jgi:F0F1-type ATP synthase assembly protein I